MFSRFIGPALWGTLIAGFATVWVMQWNASAAFSEPIWNDVNQEVAAWLAQKELERDGEQDIQMSTEPSVPKPSGPIDINRASIEALDLLPGIGEAKARAIVSHRELNGPFERIEDIMLVKGIGESIFSKMKEQITVQNTQVNN